MHNLADKKIDNYFKYDIYRYYKKYNIGLIELYKKPQIQYLKYFRKYQKSKHLLYKIILIRLSKKYQIQIPPKTSIGKGLYIGHYGRIIINEDVKIGNNCNLATGVTIGQESRGKRKGCPTIGDECWIGTNSIIVGKINIGNNVLIAPNSFVNFDVPSNSIVIGNPAKIISSNKATEDYILNKV